MKTLFKHVFDCTDSEAEQMRIELDKYSKENNISIILNIEIKKS